MISFLLKIYFLINYLYKWSILIAPSLVLHSFLLSSILLKVSLKCYQQRSDQLYGLCSFSQRCSQNSGAAKSTWGQFTHLSERKLKLRMVKWFVSLARGWAETQICSKARLFVPSSLLVSCCSAALWWLPPFLSNSPLSS